MDVIKQLMLGGGAALAKIFTGKEEKNEFVTVIEALSPSDLHMLINALVSEGKINDAENLLFEFMKKTPSEELYKTGIGFYKRLGNFPDAKLAEYGFSRSEIKEGLDAFHLLKSKSVIF